MGPRAKLKWSRSGVTFFVRDPLRSYFDEPKKNEIQFLYLHFLTTVLRIIFELFIEKFAN